MIFLLLNLFVSIVYSAEEVTFSANCNKVSEVSNINCNNRERIINTLKNDTYSEPDEEALNGICSAYINKAIPQSDLPTEKDRQELSNCQSNLYFSEKIVNPDYIKARKCAYLEREKEASWPQIGGAARLMQIYQLGKGVPVDKELALKFACEWGKAEGGFEFQSLIYGLLGKDKDSSENLKNNDFSVCAIGISGGLTVNCQYETVINERNQMEAVLTNLKATWSPNTIKAFEKLKIASDKFFEEEARFLQYENTALGLWIEYWVQDGIKKMLPPFYEKIKWSAESNKLAKFDPADYLTIDKQLNAEYQKFISVLIKKGKEYNGEDYLRGYPEAIKQLKKSQLAWIKYRDAFEDFGQTVNPSVSYKTTLTKIRVQQFIELGNSFEIP